MAASDAPDEVAGGEVTPDEQPIRVVYLGQHGTCTRCGAACPTCSEWSDKPPTIPAASGDEEER